jgi:hypothetical protein
MIRNTHSWSLNPPRRNCPKAEWISNKSSATRTFHSESPVTSSIRPGRVGRAITLRPELVFPLRLLPSLVNGAFHVPFDWLTFFHPLIHALFTIIRALPRSYTLFRPGPRMPFIGNRLPERSVAMAIKALCRPRPNRHHSRLFELGSGFVLAPAPLPAIPYLPYLQTEKNLRAPRAKTPAIPHFPPTPTWHWSAHPALRDPTVPPKAKIRELHSYQLARLRLRPTRCRI